MCGIIAVVRRAPTRPVPSSADVRVPLGPVAEAFSLDAVAAHGADALVDAVARLDHVNALLLGLPGLLCLREDRSLVKSLQGDTAAIGAALGALERALDTAPVADIERVN